VSALPFETLVEGQVMPDGILQSLISTGALRFEPGRTFQPFPAVAKNLKAEKTLAPRSCTSQVTYGYCDTQVRRVH
jgi:hypothetical protein